MDAVQFGGTSECAYLNFQGEIHASSTQLSCRFCLTGLRSSDIQPLNGSNLSARANSCRRGRQSERFWGRHEGLRSGGLFHRGQTCEGRDTFPTPMDGSNVAVLERSKPRPFCRQPEEICTSVWWLLRLRCERRT